MCIRDREQVSLRIDPVDGGFAARLDRSRLEDSGELWVTLSLGVTVPEGTRIVARTDLGGIRVRGGLASCEVVSDQGEVSLSGIRGTVRARCGSGALEVTDVRGERVELESGYGAVRLADALADAIRIVGSNGDVFVEDVTAATIEVVTEIGALDLARVDGHLTARTSSGAITLRGAAAPRAELVTGFGAIAIEDAAGELTAATSRGDVAVEDFRGALAVESDFGSIEARGVFRELEARGGSGDVRVTARPGSTPEGAWKLGTSQGDVTIGLPSEFSCRLEARTGEGTVRSDFPVVAEAGFTVGERALRGAIGRGGRTLELATSTGEIHVVRGEAR